MPRSRDKKKVTKKQGRAEIVRVQRLEDSLDVHKLTTAMLQKIVDKARIDEQRAGKAFMEALSIFVVAVRNTVRYETLLQVSDTFPTKRVASLPAKTKRSRA